MLVIISMYFLDAAHGKEKCAEKPLRILGIKLRKGGQSCVRGAAPWERELFPSIARKSAPP